jgi:uncharacterized spore protein YtfJ
MNVDELLGGVRDAIAVKRVYCDRIERDGMTIVPAATVRGGGGGGSGDSKNGGGGFGLHARPVGAFVITGDQVRRHPAVDIGRLATLAAAVLVVLLWRRG